MQCGQYPVVISDPSSCAVLLYEYVCRRFGCDALEFGDFVLLAYVMSIGWLYHDPSTRGNALLGLGDVVRYLARVYPTIDIVFELIPLREDNECRPSILDHMVKRVAEALGSRGLIARRLDVNDVILLLVYRGGVWQVGVNAKLSLATVPDSSVSLHLEYARVYERVTPEKVAEVFTEVASLVDAGRCIVNVDVDAKTTESLESGQYTRLTLEFGKRACITRLHGGMKYELCYECNVAGKWCGVFISKGSKRVEVSGKVADITLTSPVYVSVKLRDDGRHSCRLV